MTTDAEEKDWTAERLGTALAHLEAAANIARKCGLDISGELRAACDKLEMALALRNKR